MPRIIILLVSVGVLLASTIHPLSAATQPSRAAAAPTITDQYIVSVKPGRDARGVAGAAGVTPRHVFTRATRLPTTARVSTATRQARASPPPGLAARPAP